MLHMLCDATAQSIEQPYCLIGETYSALTLAKVAASPHIGSFARRSLPFRRRAQR